MGNNGIYHFENLIAPFLVHKLLGPRPRESLEGGGGLPPPPLHRLYPKGILIPQHQPQPHFQPPETAPTTAFTSPVTALHPLWDCLDGPPPSPSSKALPRPPPPPSFLFNVGLPIAHLSAARCHTAPHAQGVASVAEAMGHHPDVHITGYKHVRIVVSTHEAGGLTALDFALAAKIDALPVEYDPAWLRGHPSAQGAGAGTNASQSRGGISRICG